MEASGTGGFRVRDGRGMVRGRPWPARSAPTRGTHRVAYLHRWPFGPLRYIDAPVCRDADTDADGNCTDGGGSERVYYTHDAQMNVASLVDANGAALEPYWFRPYGALSWIFLPDWSYPMTWSASRKNELLFGGYRYDADANVYHVRHRVYHPTLGRWGQRDIAGYADGTSPYEYARGNAPTGTDPSGLSTEAPIPSYCCAEEIRIRIEGQFEDETSVLLYQPTLIGRAPERSGDPTELGDFIAEPERNQDTGQWRRWVGGKVQFIGSTSGDQELCDMTQLVSIEKERVDGRPSPREGTTFDDFRDAGVSGQFRRDPPFRQILANGDMSWFDHPAVGFTGQATTIESHLTFETCLVSRGINAPLFCPHAKCCVEWSLEILVRNRPRREYYARLKAGKPWCTNYLAGWADSSMARTSSAMVGQAPVRRRDGGKFRGTGATDRLKTTQLMVVLCSLVGLEAGGCTTQEEQKRQSIQAWIAGFNHDDIKMLHCGRPVVIGTENTEHVIASGEHAVPLLVEALSPDSPVKTGYAAYCLEALKAHAGAARAHECLETLEERGYTIENDFAILAIEKYLAEVEGREIKNAGPFSAFR